MADNDYLCVYRQFFEEFAKSFQLEESRPMRLTLYDLSVDELVGEVMVACVNFLTERKCPRSLVVPITRIVTEEFFNEAKKQPEEVNTPLKLNKKTHDKILEVCLRYTDNEKLSCLPGPVQETHYSTHSTKHTRRRMEDRLICLPRFNSLHAIPSNSEAGFYGIFDGHAGVNAACYAVSHLHQYLAESQYYPQNPIQAFRQAFQKTETKYNLKDANSGTAVLAILHQPTEKKLTVAWVGDSQGMLVDIDSYIMLIDPHKPERKDETKRIEDLGGFIIKSQSVYRVNGGLAISRAIGDQKLKPYVSAEPEIRVVNLSGSEHFIVMGCDGLWDVVEPLQVIETVYFEVKKSGGQIDTVARRLVDLAKENNSTDNISVIVIFLTDPAEISNRSVDLTGHRPKILLQDGVIMETNFQASEKSQLSDPGKTGVYEANGNHFEDHMKNEFEEDFGPETDVDAIDDVLTSPTKNMNPFSNESWLKNETDENTNKLIEFTRQEAMNIGDRIMEFSEEFGDSLKATDEKESNEEISNDVKFDKFSVDNINPFESSATNNRSETMIFSNNIAENNKYVEEMKSRKEEADNFLDSNFVSQSPELNLVNVTQSNDSFILENSVTQSKEDVLNNTINSEDLLNLEKLVAEEEMRQGSIVDLKSEKILHNPDTISNELDGNPELNLKSREHELNSPKENVPEPLDARKFPGGFCSGNEVFEAENISQDLSSVEENNSTNDKKLSPDLLLPSAPDFDGEGKDEVVAESGGEVDDSEDEGWNYIKVDSRNRIPSDLIPVNNENSDAEKATMNSQLNPNAAEFVPVAPISENEEFSSNVTPRKAIPQDLSDIVASSPNWTSMDTVKVPEEETFLKEIKSRPSNIFENDSPQEKETRELVEGFVDEVNAEVGHNQAKNAFSSSTPSEEVCGLSLANDMTSSFIDPSTMSPQNNLSKEPIDFTASPEEGPMTNCKKSLPKDSAPVELSQVDPGSSSKLPDLLSPVSAPDTSSISTSPEVPISTEVLAPVPPASDPVALKQAQPPSLEPDQIKSVDLTPATKTPPPTPSNIQQQVSEVLSDEAPEKSSLDVCKPNEIIPTSLAKAINNVASAPTATSVKKDIKKAANAKPSSSKTTKTSVTTKPLINGTKTSAPTKKPTPTLPVKPAMPAAKNVTSPASKNTTAPRVSAVSKTTRKPTTPGAPSTLNKVSARPKSATTTLTVSKTTTQSTASVTNSVSKTTTSTVRSSLTKTSTSVAAAPKPKPRVPSAPIEKKQSPPMNGDVKSTVKRTEITAKPGPATATTATTRVVSSSRPATAPTKPTSLKTAVSSTRTVTAKPRTSVLNKTSSVTSNDKMSTPIKKTVVGVDKQVKEIANRLTSKTSTLTKTNGVAGKTTTVTKTKKSTTTITKTTPPSKTNNDIDDKTEKKAETIVNENVEIIQSENENLLIENTKDINLINSIASQ